MFSIVCIARESADVLERFLDHHFKQGVEKVLLYFDGPEGQAFQSDFIEKYGADRLSFKILELSDYPVRLGEIGPPSFETRQGFVHRQAQLESTTEWLITLDADEFLVIDDFLLEYLKQTPEDISSISLPVVEAVWGPLDSFGSDYGCTYFRSSFKRRFCGNEKRSLRKILRYPLAKVAYGSDAWLFNDNVCGHASGRHFFRSSCYYDYIGPHHAVRNGVMVTRNYRPNNKSKNARSFIAHFDAIGFDRWVEKMRRRIHNEIRSPLERPVRRLQFEKFRGAYEQYVATKDKSDLEELMMQLYGLSAKQFKILQLFKCAFRKDLFS